MVMVLPFADIQVPSPGFGAMGLSHTMGSNLSLKKAEPVLLRAIELGCTSGILLLLTRYCHTTTYIAPLPTLLLISTNTSTKPLEGLDLRLTYTTCTASTPKRHWKSLSLPWMRSERPVRPSISESPNARPQECSATSIARVDAVQAEYSAFETVYERSGLLEACRELGVAYAAYSPLGHGWLVDDFAFTSPDDFAPGDFRRTAPKFQGENFYKNRAIVDEIKKLADRKGCTLAQIALAWVAAQGMIAIPGTTKASRLAENFASREIDLTEEEQKEMREIIDAAKPHGDRYDAARQAMVGH